MGMLVAPYRHGTTVSEYYHLASPSGGMLDFPSLNLTGYQMVLVEVDGLVVDTEGANIVMTLYIAGTRKTAGYKYAVRSIATNSVAVADSSNAASSSILCTSAASADANSALCFGFWIGNVDAALYKPVTFDGMRMSATTPNVARNFGGGLLEETGAVTGLRIAVSSGTITSGKATIYRMETV